jgi:hypothetical protein
MIPFWEKLSAPDGTVKRDLRELMSAVDVDAMVCLCERTGVDDEYDGTMERWNDGRVDYSYVLKYDGEVAAEYIAKLQIS